MGRDAQGGVGWGEVVETSRSLQSDTESSVFLKMVLAAMWR